MSRVEIWQVLLWIKPWSNPKIEIMNSAISIPSICQTKEKAVWANQLSKTWSNLVSLKHTILRRRMRHWGLISPSIQSRTSRKLHGRMKHLGIVRFLMVSVGLATVIMRGWSTTCISSRRCVLDLDQMEIQGWRLKISRNSLAMNWICRMLDVQHSTSCLSLIEGTTSFPWRKTLIMVS